MAILSLNKLRQANKDRKMRNQPCPCNSGLKYKACHGDESKRQRCSAIANLAMGVLITHQRGRSGLMKEDDVDTVVGQIQEHIYNLLDPDYTPEPPKKEEPESQVAVPSEDKQREDSEEEAKEVVEEVTGEEKINGIREAAGIERCPKCLGVMMQGESMCSKCKKGH